MTQVKWIPDINSLEVISLRVVFFIFLERAPFPNKYDVAIIETVVKSKEILKQFTQLTLVCGGGNFPLVKRHIPIMGHLCSLIIQFLQVGQDPLSLEKIDEKQKIAVRVQAPRARIIEPIELGPNFDQKNQRLNSRIYFDISTLKKEIIIR
eukprot:Lithocolla_globosa_v1_NODE_5586_length_1215_cov_7.127586.p2 type:complete len:151 gc:universal NODE_5586_length_1215_cov_7.127586:201-653(+)